jgi:spermidine/putrescine transport system substrate-binding protein
MNQFDSPEPPELLSRREILRRGARLGGAAGALALASAGWSSRSFAAAPLSGTLKFLTYPGWIGKGEYAAFKKLYPKVSIKEDTNGVGSTAAIAAKIQTDPHAYDFLLLGRAGVPQLQASGVLASIDYSKIPNIRYMPERFRKLYPWGIPTDYGKIGYAYRKDLITERPTTWKEFFALAPKYSGKVILLDVMEDCLGNTLIMLGYSGNTHDPKQLAQAKAKLLSIKPHVQAVIATDVAKPLITGGAVLTMDWDFDIAVARQKQQNIEWVVPKEGLMAYIEGWVGVKTSSHLDAIEAFMNFHLRPKQYADFVNTTGTAYLMPAASPLIKKSISTDPILAFNPSIIKKIQFEAFKGKALGIWNQTWNEFKAA